MTPDQAQSILLALRDHASSADEAEQASEFCQSLLAHFVQGRDVLKAELKAEFWELERVCQVSTNALLEHL